jgi:hypothetical protein
LYASWERKVIADERGKGGKEVSRECGAEGEGREEKKGQEYEMAGLGHLGSVRGGKWQG